MNIFKKNLIFQLILFYIFSNFNFFKMSIKEELKKSNSI